MQGGWRRWRGIGSSRDSGTIFSARYCSSARCLSSSCCSTCPSGTAESILRWFVISGGHILSNSKRSKTWSARRLTWDGALTSAASVEINASHPPRLAQPQWLSMGAAPIDAGERECQGWPEALRPRALSSLLLPKSLQSRQQGRVA